jgi:superoxide dismutase, Fe-Mn family
MTHMEPAWQLALEANFGTVQRWREDFLACAQNANGEGRVQLCFAPHTGALVNGWFGHGQASAADTVPLLTLPKSADLAQRVDTIDWSAAYAHYQEAVHAASEGSGANAEYAAKALVLDVRRRGVFEKASTLLPDAQWRDPALVATWAKDLPSHSELLVYCVYGHEVGRVTALRLRAAGLNARYLEGGIDGWQQAGRPVVEKPR